MWNALLPLCLAATPQRRVVRQACACTSLDDFRSNGVDVRPRIGCLVDPDGTYCYVRTTCAGSFASSAYPGAHYIVGCSAASPPPPAPAACTDPLFAQQWHLPRARVTDAWLEVPDRGAGVDVVVVDDGVDLAHPDLSLAGGYYAWNANGERVSQAAVSADVTHGTAVAGVVAALANNAGRLRRRGGRAPCLGRAALLAECARVRRGRGRLARRLHRRRV